MSRKTEVKTVSNVQIKLHVGQVADTSNPFQRMQTQLEISVDGKKLNLPPLQQLSIRMDVESQLPLVTLAFLAPQLQLEQSGPTRLIQEELQEESHDT